MSPLEERIKFKCIQSEMLKKKVRRLCRELYQIDDDIKRLTEQKRKKQ